jgi:hypothetical protein
MEILEKIHEFNKIVKYPLHGIEKYSKRFDNKKIDIKLNLVPQQIEVINSFENNRFTVVKKSRQTGLSTLFANYAAIKCGFYNPLDSRPEQIVIICHKLESGSELLNKVKKAIETLPKWLDISYVRNTATYLLLSNGCEIKVSSISGYDEHNPTMVILDEAAFFNTSGNWFWDKLLTSVAVGGKVLVGSSSNGIGTYFDLLFKDAKSGNNDFNPVQMHWYLDDRFNKGLFFVKTDNAYDWVRANGYNFILPDSMNTFSDYEIKGYIKNGFKPISPKFIQLCRCFRSKEELENEWF